MYLSLNDHRVDAGAAVVQRIEAADFCLAGGAVDVDHTQVDAKREGEVGRVVVVHGFKPWLQARGWLVVGLPSHF